MIIGMPKELKNMETRIVMIPKLAKELVEAGHEVLIETGAGIGCGATDDMYREVGAKIVPDAKTIYKESEFITKWKEFKPEEMDVRFSKDQIIIGAFHLGEAEQRFDAVKMLKESKCTALSWELIQKDDGERATVTYMSEMAGSIAPLLAAQYMQYSYGGAGKSLIGMCGQPKTKVMLLGGGNAGYAAAKVLRGFDCAVTIFEINKKRIDFLRERLPGMNIECFDIDRVKECFHDSDVFINTIYPKATDNSHMFTREDVRAMRDGSVIIDLVNINSVETGHYTTVSEPYFIEEGVIHSSIDYLPALYPHTAVEIMYQDFGKYIRAIANNGVKKACDIYPELRRAISFVNGKIVHEDIAVTHNEPCMSFEWSEI